MNHTRATPPLPWKLCVWSEIHGLPASCIDHPPQQLVRAVLLAVPVLRKLVARPFHRCPLLRAPGILVENPDLAPSVIVEGAQQGVALAPPVQVGAGLELPHGGPIGVDEAGCDRGQSTDVAMRSAPVLAWKIFFSKTRRCVRGCALPVERVSVPPRESNLPGCSPQLRISACSAARQLGTPARSKSMSCPVLIP